MATPTKPILHNGFEIKDGLIVKNRIDRVFFTEVYALSNKFIYFSILNRMKYLINMKNTII